MSAVIATVQDERVTLEWQTYSEKSNAGFRVQHRTDLGFEEVNFIDGFGTSSDTHEYSYLSPPLAPGRHEFRLIQVSTDGREIQGAVIPVMLEMSTSFHVSEVYPNPSDALTRLTISLVSNRSVTVDVFDTLGRRISTQTYSNLRENVPNTIFFDTSGMRTGIYFIRASTPSSSQTRKVVVAR